MIARGVEAAALEWGGLVSSATNAPDERGNHVSPTFTLLASPRRAVVPGGGGSADTGCLGGEPPGAGEEKSGARDRHSGKGQGRHYQALRGQIQSRLHGPGRRQKTGGRAARPGQKHFG